MEINHPNPNNPRRRDHGYGPFIGIFFLVAGALWLLYGLDVLPECVFDALFSWQVLLMVIGGYLLCQRNWIGGGIVAGVGALFFITGQLDVHISFGRIILPLIFIVVGVAILCDRQWGSRKKTDGEV